MNRQIYLLLSVFFLSLMSEMVQAQYTLATTQFYNIRDGLAGTHINSVVQDSLGYLWIGTPYSLSRFNGQNFINFSDAPNQPHQISSHNIEQLFVDGNGKIVIQYANNIRFLDRIDPSTFRLEKIDLLPSRNFKGLLAGVRKSCGGSILFASLNTTGTYVYRLSSDAELEPVFELQEQRKSPLPELQYLELPNGDFLLNDSQKGLRLFSAGGRLKRIFQPEDFPEAARPEVYPAPASLLELDNYGRIWLSFERQQQLLRIVALEDKQPIQLALEDFNGTEASRMWEDQSGNVIFGFSRGATTPYIPRDLRCLRNDGKWETLSKLLDESPRILSLWSENFLDFFVLGLDNGLKIVRNNQFRVRKLLNMDHLNGNWGKIIRGITEGPDSTIYFAQEVGNWYRIDRRTWQLDTIQIIHPHTGNRIDFRCGYGLEFQVPHYLWGSICEPYDDLAHLVRYDMKADSFAFFSIPGLIDHFTFDNEGNLWVAASTRRKLPKEGQLYYFDRSTDQFEPYTDAEGNNPLSEVRPHFIHQSGQTLWVGTDGGLFQIDLSTQRQRIYTIDARPDNELLSNTIYTIHEDRNGQIWLGTTNGLSMLDPQTRKIITYTTYDGLASNIVAGIQPSDEGGFWISTFDGLSYFDPERATFRSFSTTDGFSHHEFNRLSFHGDQDGNLYFGTVNGLNIFRPESLLKKEQTHRIRLDRYVRFDSRFDSLFVRDTGLVNLKKIVVPPQTDYFQLDFFLPFYLNPEQNRYQVWLEGKEDGWTDLGNQNFVKYHSLPAGNYTLHVKALDPNSNPTVEVYTLNIEVKPYFYETFGFWALITLLISGLIYAFTRYRLTQQLRLEQLRTKISSDLHDELSGLLTGIAIQSEIMLLDTKDQKRSEKLQRMASSSRKAISKMSDVIWSVDSRKDKIQNLIDRMQEHVEEILLPLGFTYQLDVGSINPQARISPTIRQEVYFIFKEAINNIAKHSNGDRVEIFLGNKTTGFLLSIWDNGTGSDIQQKSISNGIVNMRMRAHRIDGELHLKNGVGFTVLLRRPKLIDKRFEGAFSRFLKGSLRLES